MRYSLVLVALVGCGFSNRLVGGGGDDMPMEAGMPGEAGEGSEPAVTECMVTPWSFTPAEFDPCMIAAPMAPPAFVNGNYVINSATGMMTGPMGTSVQLAHKIVNGIGVVSFTTLDVPTMTTIRGEGANPLAIVSWGNFTMSGNILVNSEVAGMNPGTFGPPGAGANPTTCGNGQGGNGSADGSGDGGGGGGGYAAIGGRGGNGNNIANSGGTSGQIRTRPARIEGGCRGGNAPAGDGGNPGDGGSGGGAIGLFARQQLAVSGLVHAGGSGGTGGATDRNGGGGGGSGGMIKLESSVLMVSGILAANGGAGGGGCQGATAGKGANGTPNATEPTQANSEGGGTDGGGGGYMLRPIGNTASAANDGGGGGGGGVGYIAYKGHASQAVAGVSSPVAMGF